MNRRDTIIIAVLLNACLLAVLFVMAINSDDGSSSDLQDSSQSIVDLTEQSINAPKKIMIATDNPQEISLHTGDEIDNTLKQYANNPQLILIDEETESLDKEPTMPPPAVTTTPPQNPEPHFPTPSKFVDITVKKGDALEKIARANNTTVDAIKKTNNLTSNKLNIGQVLKVPVDTKKASVSIAANKIAEKEDKDKVASGEPEFYTVKSGDNPWKIAKQFHVKFDDLLKLNNLDEEKARNLKIGDKLRVK